MPAVAGWWPSAARVNNFVRIDMEGSAYTERTLEMVRQLHASMAKAGAVGAVIQAYLRRSPAYLEELLADGIRIRLCKGAYQEPPEIAFPKKSEVDANYLRLARLLLKSGIYHGLATHDERIIREMIRFAGQEKIAPESFEFQMLYGVRRELQQQIVRRGYRMRVYIPFGTEWYPYFMRRLAERPGPTSPSSPRTSFAPEAQSRVQDLVGRTLETPGLAAGPARHPSFMRYSLGLS